jgi:hypothetical protein
MVVFSKASYRFCPASHRIYLSTGFPMVSKRTVRVGWLYRFTALYRLKGIYRHLEDADCRSVAGD